MDAKIKIVLLLLIITLILSIYGIIASLFKFNPTNIENLNIIIMVIFGSITGILFGIAENLLEKREK